MTMTPAVCIACSLPIDKGYRVVVMNTDNGAHVRKRIASLHRACWASWRAAFAVKPKRVAS